MNIKRIAILGVAAIAAGAAAMLVRGMMANRTAAQSTPAVVMGEILVASQDISAGHPLDSGSVRWQAWPESATMPTFITRAAQPDLTKAITGTVARAPLIAGQPVTEASIVRTGATGFMAATVTPGMRAIGLPVTAETIAGGFILPNDRVDVVLTRETPSGSKVFESSTILSDVRVLAVEQTSHQGKDQETVLGKTATLEVTEPQAELVAKAQQSGVVSLTLRSVGDSTGMPTAMDFTASRQAVATKPSPGRPRVDRAAPLLIYRYGVLREQTAAGSSGPAPAEAPETDTAAPATPTTVTEGTVALETPR